MALKHGRKNPQGPPRGAPRSAASDQGPLESDLDALESDLDADGRQREPKAAGLQSAQIPVADGLVEFPG